MTIVFDDLSFFKVKTLKADGSGADMPLDVRNAIQFLAFCLRDKAELKLNFKHVAAWRYSVSSGDPWGNHEWWELQVDTWYDMVWYGMIGWS